MLTKAYRTSFYRQESKPIPQRVKSSTHPQWMHNYSRFCWELFNHCSRCCPITSLEQCSVNTPSMLFITLIKTVTKHSHDSWHVAVYTFSQKLINDYIKPSIKILAKSIISVMDQYNNYKTFAYLVHHKQDFGFGAEWNFYATSHGKNICDGVGGTLKTLQDHWMTRF